ncbi:MAG: hypothetical protein U0324_24760 [Polyangiales bacterium]
MARRLALTLLLALAACRRTSAPADAPTQPPEPDVVLPGDAPAPTGSCRLAGVTWVARPASGERFTADDGLVGEADAGDGLTSAIETVAAAWGADANPWVAWVDARDRTARLARAGRRDVATASLGAGNRSDLALAVTGAARDVPLLAWSHDAMAGRVHSLRAGAAMATGCDQPEGRDEALQVAVVATPQGALLAWDDVAPGAAGSVVMVQRVAPATTPAPVVGRCPAPHQASPSNQDAGDPALAATPEGGAALFWLDARDLDPGQYNDTVTDLWGLLLDGAGVAKGVPLRLTTTPGHRFGLSAAVATEGPGVWLAYRVVPNSGTEARGDGGQVAVMRLTRGATGLGRAGDAAVVTGGDAVPTGMPRVFARRQGAEVWWRERGPAGVVTWRRALDAQGRALPSSPATPERALHGLLPAWSDPQGALVAALVRTAGGGVGVARYRCGG